MRFEYTTSEEREQLIQDNSSLYLIEEQNITEGNFLIFAEQPLPVDIKPTYEELENQLLLMADSQEGGIL